MWYFVHVIQIFTQNLEKSYQHDLKYLRLLHLLPRWSQTSLMHSDLHDVSNIHDLTTFSESQPRRASNVLLITGELQCAGSELRVLHDKSDIQVFQDIFIDKYEHLRDYNLVFEKFRVLVIVITDLSVVHKRWDWCVVSMISTCIQSQIPYRITLKSVQSACCWKGKIRYFTERHHRQIHLIYVTCLTIGGVFDPHTENIPLWSYDEKKEYMSLRPCHFRQAIIELSDQR